MSVTIRNNQKSASIVDNDVQISLDMTAGKRCSASYDNTTIILQEVSYNRLNYMLVIDAKIVADWIIVLDNSLSFPDLVKCHNENSNLKYGNYSDKSYKIVTSGRIGNVEFDGNGVKLVEGGEPKLVFDYNMNTIKVGDYTITNVYNVFRAEVCAVGKMAITNSFGFFYDN